MNVPKLRFKGFFDEWNLTSLGEKGIVVNGLTYSPKDIVNDDSGKLVLRSSNIKSDKIDYSDTVFVNVSKYNPVLENDILICVRNGSKRLIGKNALIKKEDEGHAFGAFMTVYRSTNNKFIYQLFSTKKYYKMIDENLGARINSINNSELVKFKFFFPSLEEQKKIARFFSVIDKKLDSLKKKKELLEQYKKGVMQKIFSQELRFKDDEGKDFPEWEEKELGEVAVRVTLKNKENNSNVLTISARLGLISQLEYYNKSVSSSNITNYYLLHEGDFAYNKSYSNGYPMGAIKRLKKYELGVVSTLYICFRFKEDLSPAFYEQYFESGLHNNQIQLVAQEGARNHGLLNIGVNDFFNTSVPVPSKEEQQKIADFLTALDNKIDLVEQQINQTELWKKGLLQQMFV